MSSIKYRPEIDGLRAIAVVPVILFHAGISAFAGGFVGVDIFFVISGYLITLIIHTEVQEHRFSIVNFYERRARRILPALFAVCAASIICAWIWMLPNGMDRFGQSVSAVSVFSSNLLFWYHTGYFDSAAELKPLLHTWSLAVEEQYYVFFPLLLIALKRLSNRHLTMVLAALGLLSLGLSQWAAYTHPSADFFFLPTRAWELAVGALIAIAIPNAGKVESRVLAGGGAALGLALIAWAIVTFDSTTPIPSAWALAPVLGSALIIVCARRGTAVGWFLSSRPVVGIGLISYSAYLWHQPMLAFARIRDLNEPATWFIFLLCVLSIGVAYLSWRFIERPFRDKRQVTRTPLFAGAIAGSVILFAFGVYAHLSSGIPSRIDPVALKFLSSAKAQSTLRRKCEGSNSSFISPDDACVLGLDTAPTVAVWGDSHAAAVAHALGAGLKKYGKSLKVLSSAGCMPTVGYHVIGSELGCDRYTPAAYHYLLSNKDIKIVVLVARYTTTFTGKPFDNGRGGVGLDGGHYAVPTGKTGASYSSDSERADALGKLILSTTRALVNSGKRVVVVYPIPEAGWNVPEYMARSIQYRVLKKSTLWTPNERYQERAKLVFRELNRLPHNESVVRVYPDRSFCRDAGRCILESQGKPLYTDNTHVNEAGAHMVTEQIIAGMVHAGWLR